ncbi:MAG: DUF2087 domain-containing protein [Erysipelotrichaceae bacterium]|nr:DUF2087 domain-containing protein [Erysipelotrichaceae bacterium]
MEPDCNELTGYLQKGKLTQLPSKRKKKLLALVWLAEHIPADRIFSEKEFNELLNQLHTFQDPATLRRELYDYFLINRSPYGKEYHLNPKRPTLEELLEKHCGNTDSKKTAETLYEKDGKSSIINDSDRNPEDAEDFRNRIHAEALKRVQAIRPEITSVIDRYPTEAYFQQIWDYPGAWYTIVAIPEDVKSKEALIDMIVRDTLKGSQNK